jgi:hypothetical protein
VGFPFVDEIFVSGQSSEIRVDSFGNISCTTNDSDEQASYKTLRSSVQPLYELFWTKYCALNGLVKEVSHTSSNIGNEVCWSTQNGKTSEKLENLIGELRRIVRNNSFCQSLRSFKNMADNK